MIWKSTKYIGVGVAWDSNGKVVIVAHYKPAGNIAGYFAENVSVIDPIKHSGKIRPKILDCPRPVQSGRDENHRTGTGRGHSQAYSNQNVVQRIPED